MAAVALASTQAWALGLGIVGIGNSMFPGNFWGIVVCYFFLMGIQWERQVLGDSASETIKRVDFPGTGGDQELGFHGFDHPDMGILFANVYRQFP